jgi:cell division protein FtsI (penicillin-binding protein 3)
VGLTERRIGLLFALFLALLSVAAVRALWLGTVQAGSLQRAAATQQVDELQVPARRGTISDRHGVELAVSQPAVDVAVTPYLVKAPLKVAKQLAPIVGLTQAELLRKLSRRDTGFVYLARKVVDARAASLRKLKIAGVQVIPTSRRAYPRRWLASQVLGAVGTDANGLSGLEYARERVLGGVDGRRRIVKDALGEPITVQETRPAMSGHDVQLTLDAQLQTKVEDVLAQVGAERRPKGATAVVMNPHTGAILAMANWPRVDANDLGAAPPYASQNRAVGFNYEPGSTFKPVTVAGALQDGAVKPGDYFHLPPKITVADREIGEAHDRGAINLTTSQILAQSSNVGTVRIGQRLGARRFDGWVRRFGFGRPTGIELPGEQSGQVLDPDHYSGSSMGNLPIGQGESVTPMQLATAYSTIANGGTLLRPHIISRVAGKPTVRPRGRRVISARTAAQVSTMLKGVLEPGGTASQAAIDGYSLAGKTGTANKIETSGPYRGQYSKTRFIASFAGFAPARDPKLLVTVMVDEPHGEIYGSEVAAPAFQEIMSFALAYLGIAPG